MQIKKVDELDRIFREGVALYSFYGYKTDGYFQSYEEIEASAIPVGGKVQPGDVKFVDRNNDGVFMRLERSITAVAAAVLAGWLLAVVLCNGLFYRNIVNYEILYHGMAECWAQADVRSRTRKICLLAVRVLQVAAVACITCSRLRRTGSLFLGTAIGFCGGVFFSLLVWSRGMAGGFLGRN